MTETNLRSAYAGESQAHMRYWIFAERAERSGFPNVARMFKAISHAERIHAGNHFRNITSRGGYTTISAAAFGSKNPSEDLQAGIDGETFEIKEMYPAYLSVARLQEEKAAELSFTWAVSAEKMHLGLFERAKKTVDEGRDQSPEPIQVCSVCGYTLEGDAPAKCPICGATKESFKTF